MKFFLSATALLLINANTVLSTPCAKVTMVGTGGAGPSPGRVGPCTMIQVGDTEDLGGSCTDRTLIFDLGRGTYTRLLELDAAFNMTSIEAIFASHSHQDHVLEMGYLAYFHWFDNGIAPGSVYTPLNYITPNGTTLAFLESAMDNLQAEMALRANAPAPASLNITTFDTELGDDPQIIYNNGGVVVHSVSVPHFKYEAVAYHVSIEGIGTVVISADINDEGGPYIQKFSSLNNGEVDVLVHEVTLNGYTIKPGKPSEGTSRAHTMPPRVVENANALNAKALVLTHLLPSPARPDSMGPVPNAPYRTVDDFAYSMKYEGYNNEVIVADDLTAIYLGTGVDQRGYEVYLTNGSKKFDKAPPDDYVSFRDLVGESSGDNFGYSVY